MIDQVIIIAGENESSRYSSSRIVEETRGSQGRRRQSEGNKCYVEQGQRDENLHEVVSRSFN